MTFAIQPIAPVPVPTQAVQGGQPVPVQPPGSPEFDFYAVLTHAALKNSVGGERDNAAHRVINGSSADGTNANAAV
jgi:hypothetical protein